jgi:hypothetical protein
VVRDRLTFLEFVRWFEVPTRTFGFAVIRGSGSSGLLNRPSSIVLFGVVVPFFPGRILSSRFIQGCVMRYLVALNRRAGVFLSMATLAGGLIGGGRAFGIEGFTADPVTQSGFAWGSESSGVPSTDSHSEPHRPAVSVRSLARQSVPDLNRASYYRLGEVFTHTKVVMPLLVADLEPQGALFVRPMSGRSVGATPSARWTKAVSTPSSSAPSGR